jgi:hypothetical protein
MARFFNVNVPIVASRTGVQLLLADADYSVPWLVHQQQLHNQAHQEYAQQHAQQQQQQDVAEAPAGSSASRQQQQQQQDSAAGSTADGSAAGAGAPQQPSASASSSSSAQQQQQQQRIALPPGVDPSQPVPLLLLMAHPAGPFHKALAAFKTRICCANIKHDTTVPYCTAAICTANPYEARPPTSVNPELYPSVVQPAQESEQDAVFPDAKGRSRLLMLLLFLPFFPAFYSYSVAKGLLHHREARKRPLDSAWLQQYRAAAEVLGAGLNPFSRQASRQLQERLEHQQQQQQDVPAGGEASSVAAAAAAAASGDDAAVGGAVEASLFAVPAAAEAGTTTNMNSSSSSRPSVSVGRGLRQLLSGSSSSSNDARQPHVQALHTQIGSDAAANGVIEETGNAAALDRMCTAAAPPPPAAAAAAAAAEQTEDEVLRASGGSSALLLSREVSRRLTAAGEHAAKSEAVLLN